MKRFFGAMVTVLLVLAVAGNAAAAFEKTDLVLVAYNKTTSMEAAFEIGAFDVVNGDITTGNFSGLFDMAAMGGSVNVGVFGHQAGSIGGVTYGTAYFVTTEPTAPPINASSLGSFIAGSSNVMNYYNSLYADANPDNYGLTTYPSSYSTKMNSNGNAQGFYSNYNGGYGTEGKKGEAVLDSVEDVVTLYLYGYNLSQPINGAGYDAIITVSGNGNVEVSAVPIPASLLLLGSGLLGLLGIRRKNA